MGSEIDLLNDEYNWIDITKILVIELHERIVKGCEKIFFDANKNRFVVKSDGEKYVSVGKIYFDETVPK